MKKLLFTVGTLAIAGARLRSRSRTFRDSKRGDLETASAKCVFER